MIAELVYTSAPRTLDGPGYGVVAKSAALPDRLESFLRRLNRYDYALTGGDGVPDGPVVFSHALHRDDAHDWHVLSRIAGAGYDYTHRAVFLAHHVAVTGDELDGTPAVELMRDPSLFQTQWDGYVGVLPDRSIAGRRRKPASGEWAALVGDGDWSRAWVNRWAAREGHPGFLIVPGGVNVVALFSEAMSHLPADEAGRVAFITCLNGDTAGMPFDWIGLVAGSEPARSIPHRFPEQTLDLTGPLGPAPPAAARRRRAAAHRPRVEAVAEVRRPAATTRGDDDFDVLWKDEIRGRPGHATTHSRPVSKSAPPPPPPPEGFLRRNALPIGLVAAAALVAVVGASAWTLGARSAQTRSAEPTTVVAAQQPPAAESAPSVGPAPIPQESVPPLKGPDEKFEAPPTGPRTEQGPHPAPGLDAVPIERSVAPAESRPRLGRRMVHVGGWLPAMLAKEKSRWTELVAVEVAGTASLSILSGEESGLRFERATDASDGRIAVTRAKGGNASIELRCNQGKIESRLQGEPDDELIGRLQFCALEVTPTPDLIGPVRVVTTTDIVGPVRVVLTPTLPAVPISGFRRSREFWSKEPAAFFDASAIYRLPRRARMRVDRVTLSILPPEQGGWRFDRAEVAFGEVLKTSLKIDGPGVKWAGDLKVGIQSIDPNQPAIEVNLFPPLSGPGVGDRPRTRGQEKESKAARAESKERDRESEEAGDSAALLEVFRHFGRVHGAIVAPLRKPGSSEDVEFEVLRFGDAGPEAKP